LGFPAGQAHPLRNDPRKIAMPAPLHRRLLNEATLLGTQEILRQMPAEYSRELEEAVREGVRRAIMHYAAGLDGLDRQLRPLDQAGACF
jgi:hypothetical protein